MTSEHLVTKHVYAVGTGDCHVFLLLGPESVAVVDAGFPGTWPLVEQALGEVGRTPGDVSDILVTHCHIDHAGGLSELKEATGARVWMHAADAEMVGKGQAFRPWKAAPGLRNWWFARHVVAKSPQTFPPVAVDKFVRSGEVIPVAGGIKAVHTPGHSAGHMVFLWPVDGGVLFTGDAANNVRGLNGPNIFEDGKLAADSLRKVSGEKFRVACFAHGAPIVGNADGHFRDKWSGA